MKPLLSNAGRPKPIIGMMVALIAVVIGVYAVSRSLAATDSINDNVTGTGIGQWEYSGVNWAYYTDGGNKYMGDDHSSSAANDTATLRFSGTQVKYYGAKSPQAGIVGISIDGGAESLVDLYSATRLDNTLIYTSAVLAGGNHTLKIRLTGTKNAAANDDAAAVDRAEVVSATPTPTPGGLAADLNGDGAVNVFDLSILLAYWGKSPAAPSPTVTPTPTPTPTATATPTPPVTSAPMAYPAKSVALYHMMWSTSGSPALSTTPANVNVIRMAFAQGDPPSLTGWASDGQSQFVASAQALRARGVRMTVSIGGAGGNVNIANRQAFVNGVMAINNLVPLDGLDWDLEGAAMNQADVLWISAELKRLRGSNFAITMAPNGSNIDQYLPIAVALNNAGNLTRMGQQFYDAPVTKEQAMARIDQAVAAGIPASKYEIGMMVGSTSNYWTVDTCITNVNYIKAKYPAMGGGYLWEAGRAGTSDWANRVGNLLKS